MWAAVLPLHHADVLAISREPFGHYQGNRTAKARFFRIRWNPYGGNTDQRKPLQFRVDHCEGEWPQAGKFAHNDDFTGGEGGNDHVHATAEFSAHLLDRSHSTPV